CGGSELHRGGQIATSADFSGRGHTVEFNTLLDPLPMLLLQPVIQYYANVGARPGHALVLGFRTKVEF
ncbi:MAG TPA: hypothetical protein VEK33_15120, partial [Terriglobales bacterium]|nr:hypothetical protein [Terriglobales bacterium]